MSSMVRLLAVSVFLPRIAGHAQMTFPPWGTKSAHTTMAAAGTCQDEGCFFFSQGCQPGCKTCTDITSGDTCSEPGGTMAPTITDTKLCTYPDAFGNYKKANTPWRAPGHSPVMSPCGIAGGGQTRHPENGASIPSGPAPQGFDGRKIPEGVTTEWAQGSVQEVAWAITANHGGGYAYRLCPKSASVTEECFQANHLSFASDQSWIQYGDDKSNRTAISATRVSEGTFPKGSVWTKNPIPACRGVPAGGVGTPECPGPLFEPPLPGLFGYGKAACTHVKAGSGGHCTTEQQEYWLKKFNFNIIDKVSVPRDLKVGEYFLSFRWDCEQTPQIWNQCAHINVVASDVVV